MHLLEHQQIVLIKSNEVMINIVLMIIIIPVMKINIYTNINTVIKLLLFVPQLRQFGFIMLMVKIKKYP